MPTFYQYSYFYNIEVLKISLFLIGILPVFAGVLKALFGFVYPVFFGNTSYRKIFVIAQLFKFGCGVIEFLLVKGYT